MLAGPSSPDRSPDRPTDRLGDRPTDRPGDRPADRAAANALLDTDLLRTFAAIRDAGSFRAATGRVHRTPGAVSMQMRKLEDTVGRPLFVRDGRGVALTGDGEALLGYARRMLAVNEEAMARFRTPAVEGRVAFGAPDDYGTRWLPAILARFAARCPAVEVDATLAGSHTVLARLERGEIDVALVTCTAADLEDPATDLVHTEPLAWMGAAGGRARTLAPMPVALANRDCAWRRVAVDALDASGIAHRTVFVSEHSAGQIAALEADLAVAPLPASLLRAGLERIDTLPRLPVYHVRLAVREGAGPAALTLADAVREHMATGR